MNFDTMGRPKKQLAAVPPASLPRRSRTREALVDGAKQLIAEGRIGSMTIDEIVNRANVAKGSFYNHFPDRSALISFVFESTQAAFVAEIDEANTGESDVPTQLARGLVVYWRFGLEDRLSGQILLQINPDIAHPNVRRIGEATGLLKAGMSQNVLKVGSLDAGLIVLVGCAELGLARLLDLGDDPINTRLVMRTTCQAAMRGLGVDARRIDRVVDDALNVVIDLPRKENAEAEEARPRRQFFPMD